MTADQRKRLAREARKLAYRRAARPRPARFIGYTYSALARVCSYSDVIDSFWLLFGTGMIDAAQQPNYDDATIFPLLAWTDALESPDAR